jgi:hypothetical protein
MLNSILRVARRTSALCLLLLPLGPWEPALAQTNPAAAPTSSAAPTNAGAQPAKPGESPSASAAQNPPTPAANAAKNNAAVPAANANPPKDAVAVYMPDGQIKSHKVAVYVTHEIHEDQKPELYLLRSHALTKEDARESIQRTPILVAPNQQWSQTEGGREVSKTGTLLLFDLGDLDFMPKPMIRVRPVINWTENGALQRASGKNDVNLGDIIFASLWTILSVVVGVGLVILLARHSRAASQKLIQFVCGVDGHLSLGQSQIVCWTIVVGGVVMGYGLIRLEIPTIPSSLLALMGASLATGGVAYFKDCQKQNEAAAVAAAPAGGAPPAGAAPPAAAAPAPTAAVPAQVAPHLGDLVRNFNPGPSLGQLSLAKGQMIFWTVLLLFLFVSKSITDGAIWDIPWGLVALMGFSQAGYLAPKVVPPQ